MSDQEKLNNEQPTEGTEETAVAVVEKVAAEATAEEAVAGDPATEEVAAPPVEAVTAATVEEEASPEASAEAEAVSSTTVTKESAPEASAEAEDGAISADTVEEEAPAEAEAVSSEAVAEKTASETTTEEAAEPIAEATSPEAAAEPTAEATSPEAAAEQPAPEAASQDEAAEDDEDVNSIFNLEPRQQMSGKVKNITSFGAFVDLGLPQDGLVHISELSKRKVDKVEDVVSVGQEVDVWIKKVDRKRGRISLTMVKPVKRRIRDIEEGAEYEGTVTRLEAYGAFVDVDSERDGLVHISQITHDYIKHPQESLEVGQKVNVKVLKVNRKKRQIDLSIKALLAPPVAAASAVQQTSGAANKGQGKKAKEEIEEQEPAPTAMAVAFANLQDEIADNGENNGEGVTQESARRKQEQEDIIARTLASNN